MVSIVTKPFDLSQYLRRSQHLGFLEGICQELELPDGRFKEAEARYKAVAEWIINGAHPSLKTAAVYPQGSMALGTTTKPLNAEEFDLDGVCKISLPASIEPQLVMKLVGDRLRENGRYAAILEPKCRCWRLNYANEFHLDLTPSIPNLSCLRGGELVPDRLLKIWKATNPKGYRQWFEQRSRLAVTFTLQEADLVKMRAAIESLPQPTRLKGLLRRIVQLLKRHRDVYFSTRDSSFAPISIILTTLATVSYETCALTSTYNDEFEALVDVIRRMPSFIQRVGPEGIPGWYVWNPTTDGENFAEKWNADSRLPRAFAAWHEAALRAFSEFDTSEGLDQLGKRLNESFGPAGLKVVKNYVSDVSLARASAGLGASAAGLIVGAGGVRVKTNTFHGN